MTREDGTSPGTGRYLIVAAVIVTVFLSSYAYAAASRGAVSGACARKASRARSSACACCTGGVPAKTVERKAVPSDGVQKVRVEASAGQYSPNRIVVRAGTPIEIVFGQGDGCLAEVVFDDFGITKDLTRGGATVTLPALDRGEYTFHCGMNMVSGKLVVQ